MSAARQRDTLEGMRRAIEILGVALFLAVSIYAMTIEIPVRTPGRGA